jgi:GNAT superfamily N-acetyltransferase
LGFLSDECTLTVLNKSLLDSTTNFQCGHNDLDEFFEKDCINWSEQLLGKSYCFTLNSDPSEIICAFTVANDSIKINQLPKSRKNKLNRKIPQAKRLGSYPSVLIGRLGVNKNYKRKGIGKDLMDVIKYWFIENSNKTGCRYIVVDAYNEEEPLGYYLNNGFEFLFDTEVDEKKYSGLRIDLTKRQLFYNKIRRFFHIKEIQSEKLITRLMYFDLIVLKI